MPFHLHGHRMVTSKDQTKAYIVGGYDGYEKMMSVKLSSSQWEDSYYKRKIDGSKEYRQIVYIV